MSAAAQARACLRRHHHGHLVRCDFEQPVTDPASAREALAAMTKKARGL